jgi:pimeloyl-ACP methyl ester carboxylesterase
VHTRRRRYSRAVATYVLVHGAWVGGWCWQKVVPLLEAEGHRVVALDLPGHGDDSTAVSGMTLAANVKCIRDAVEAADERVILVGHSMGGIAITQVAEDVPGRIATLVYVSAFLPQHGQSLPELVARFLDVFAPLNIQVNESEGTISVNPDDLWRATLLGECDDEDVLLASRRLVPESLAVADASVSITPERAGRVPRVYVECLRDRMLPIGAQRAMQQAVGCKRVLTIDTDHSSFLSRPHELADHLLSLAT